MKIKAAGNTEIANLEFDTKVSVSNHDDVHIPNTLKHLNNLIDILHSRSGLYGLFSLRCFGKTTLIKYMAGRLSRKGVRSLIIDLEWGENEWIKDAIQMPDCDTRNIEILDQCVITLDELHAAILAINPSIVYIDDLALFSHDRNRCNEIKSLKRMSTDLNVPIVIAADLKRNYSNHSIFPRVPELFDLCIPLCRRMENHTISELYSAVNSFDAIFFIHRWVDCKSITCGECHKNTSGDAELIIRSSNNLKNLDLPKHITFNIRHMRGDSIFTP